MVSGKGRWTENCCSHVGPWSCFKVSRGRCGVRGSGLKMKTAASSKDLINEANALRNCVAMT